MEFHAQELVGFFTQGLVGFCALELMDFVRFPSCKWTNLLPYNSSFVSVAVIKYLVKI